MSFNPAQRVLLVGWDSADWQVITPLLEAGKMPNLARLIEGGAMGNLATIRPVLSPMLWTSIATGKRPDKHGIHGFVEPDPEGTGLRHVTSTSRKTKALWNILSQSGKRSIVANWYASHPAEPINGVVLADAFMRVSGESKDKVAPPPPQSIHPASLAEEVGEFRMHKDEIGAWDLAMFVPTLGEIPVPETGPITGLQKVLSHCGTVHGTFTHLIETQPWDFAAVYYETLDHAAHLFMQYHPPKMPHVEERLFERYRRVMNGMYRFHDMMLGRLVHLAGPNAVVIVCSDHGFLNDQTRPVETPENPAGPEAWHRMHGMLAVGGPGIVKDERVYGATILDITPTVLHVMGLPVGRDMDGKALVTALDGAPPVAFIDSWDAVESPAAGVHPPDLRVDPFAQQEAMEQLIELGYMARPAENVQSRMNLASEEARYNLAVSHLDAENLSEAAALLEALYAEFPQKQRYVMQLAFCRIMQNRPAEARALAEKFNATERNSPQVQVLLGSIAFADGRDEDAVNHLRSAEAANPRLPNLHAQIGQVYVQQEKWTDAGRAFTRALEIDPDAPMPLYGLSVVALHDQRPEDAARLALRAVGLMHYFPNAHFVLGVALFRLGWYDRAAGAFDALLKLRPNFLGAHRYLAATYLKLNDPDRAQHHRHRAELLMAAIARQGQAPKPDPTADADRV